MQSSIRRALVVVLSVMSILLGITAVASADDVVNTLDDTIDNQFEIYTVTQGDSVDVGLFLRATGPDGCNVVDAGDGKTATLTLDIPSTMSSSGPVTFDVCGLVGLKTITINTSSSTPVGDYNFNPSAFRITNNFSGGNGSYSANTAAFRLVVKAPSDTTPPVITKTVNGTAGANGWYTSDVTVNWTVTDPESTVTILSGCGTQTFLTETAAATSSCSASSAGGTAGDSVTIKIDKTGPNATLTPAGTLGANGWYTSDVTVSTSGSDTISGPVVCTADQTFTDETTSQPVNGSCTNDAGLTTDAAPISIKIDKTGPTATLAASGTLGNNGWYTSNVTVTASGNDSISGPVSCTDAVALMSDTSGTEVNGACTNNAGLSTNAAPLTVKIDKTKPSVSVTGVSDGVTYTLGSVPAAGCSTTDALSGVATEASLSSSGGPVGSITATCAGGTDNAGNSAASVSATYNVKFAWSGFRQPVDNLPALNKAKAGSAIPVKFSLAGNQGLNIFAASFPKSAVNSCDPLAVADPIDETVTAGSSSLSYDATADQYVYVWKTDKAWSGCRTLTIKLVDGQSYQANFQFTK